MIFFSHFIFHICRENQTNPPYHIEGELLLFIVKKTFVEKEEVAMIRLYRKGRFRVFN